MLAVVKALQHQRAELEGTANAVKVITDYKALEYFMSSKLLFARQARQAKILSCYYFRITYKLGKLNKADLLTRIEETKDLNQAKRDNCKQILLLFQNLDSYILQKLKVNSIMLALI